MRGIGILGKGIVSLVFGGTVAVYSAVGIVERGDGLRDYESVRTYGAVAGAGMLSLGAAMTFIGLARQEENLRKD